MKTEKEKMLSNELYNHKDAELTKERNHAYELTLRYNQTKDDETELRTSILQQLAGKLGNNVVIKPPFQCDYGYNLILGDNVFMNYGCSILDCNVVEIGNNVLMAPNVQIYAAYHPTDHTLRLKDLEYADRVKIGDNKLIGYCMGGLVAIEAARALLEAGAEVLPVVTIDTIPIVLEMEGDLLMERSYGLMVGADVSKAGHVKRDELVQMALELLKDHNNGFIEEDAILGLTGELPELAACYKKQKTLSKRERMENLKNAIPENSMQLSSEDMNRFDELFEIYKRNYRCAIGYTPKPFAGDLQALSCMDDHSPFVPVMKPGTEAFLSKCALGNLEVLPIGGNHLSCLMTPNVEGMANLLDGKGERV